MPHVLALVGEADRPWYANLGFGSDLSMSGGRIRVWAATQDSPAFEPVLTGGGGGGKARLLIPADTLDRLGAGRETPRLQAGGGPTAASPAQAADPSRGPAWPQGLSRSFAADRGFLAIEERLFESRRLFIVSVKDQ
ncbi:MAG: hypothetical protein LBP92_00100 [Deltaproteobacteria bacterium]|jgi:hypothetical protein|nr:hypothetical protein [Deltaproteobacteria bacterium]